MKRIRLFKLRSSKTPLRFTLACQVSEVVNVQVEVLREDTRGGEPEAVRLHGR
jgi:hypothetical protein